MLTLRKYPHSNRSCPSKLPGAFVPCPRNTAFVMDIGSGVVAEADGSDASASSIHCMSNPYQAKVEVRKQQPARNAWSLTHNLVHTQLVQEIITVRGWQSSCI